ncbi:MAG: TrbG/VirB9 family P-type conjugative transfer protein [Pseudomonadota bacterium]
MNFSRLLVLCFSAWVSLAAPRAHADALGAHSAHVHHRATAARHVDTPVQTSPLDALAAANDAARQHPSVGKFEAARQIYPYAPGALYELYASPTFVSAILLEPGETLNDIAAGDTSRWAVTQSTSETDSEGRTIVLVKPQADNLRTNIVLITDKRTYLIEAVSHSGSAYSAELAWSYPQVAVITPPPLAEIYTDYWIHTVRGSRPVWAPAQVSDDGRHTWIDFSPNVAATDLPPLFVISPEGAELVNYRVQGQRYIVDRLFDIAELRFGVRNPIIVRIERRSALRSPAHPQGGPHR